MQRPWPPHLREWASKELRIKINYPTRMTFSNPIPTSLYSMDGRRVFDDEHLYFLTLRITFTFTLIACGIVFLIIHCTHT